jgi:hypothetical protein
MKVDCPVKDRARTHLGEDPVYRSDSVLVAGTNFHLCH